MMQCCGSLLRQKYSPRAVHVHHHLHQKTNSHYVGWSSWLWAGLLFFGLVGSFAAVTSFTFDRWFGDDVHPRNSYIHNNFHSLIQLRILCRTLVPSNVMIESKHGQSIEPCHMIFQIILMLVVASLGLLCENDSTAKYYFVKANMVSWCLFLVTSTLTGRKTCKCIQMVTVFKLLDVPRHN